MEKIVEINKVVLQKSQWLPCLLAVIDPLTGIVMCQVTQIQNVIVPCGR